MTEIKMIRLVADEGMILTDGTNSGYAVDVKADEVDRWSEVEDMSINDDNPIEEAFAYGSE